MLDPLRPLRASALLLGAVLALGATACDDDDDSTAPEAQAQVRVVHAVADAPAVDVQLDDDTRAITNLPFGQFRPATGYLSVDAGARRVRVYATGTNTAVIDGNVQFAAGSATTVVATGRLANTSIQPLVLSDDATAPAAGQIRVRVVHGAATVSNVDVYVTAPGAALPATPTLANVPFRGVSQYLAVPSAPYQVRAYAAGNRTTPAIDVTTPAAVPAGSIVTAVALDPATAGGAPSILLLSDNR
jgi:hypothetical protein